MKDENEGKRFSYSVSFHPPFTNRPSVLRKNNTTGLEEWLSDFTEDGLKWGPSPFLFYSGIDADGIVFGLDGSRARHEASLAEIQRREDEAMAAYFAGLSKKDTKTSQQVNVFNNSP